MLENKHLKLILRIVYIAAAILIGWLLIRFALPCVLPFILALGTARLIEPAVRYLNTKLEIKRGFGAAVCTILVLALLIGISYLLVGRGIYEISSFVKQLPELFSRFTGVSETIEKKIYGFVVAAPVELQDYLQNAVNSIIETSAGFPAKIYSWLLETLSRWAASAPKMILFLMTYGISVFFMSGSYPSIIEFIMKQIPARMHEGVKSFKDDLVGVLGKWTKAQLMLMGVTFAELTIAFLFLRIDYAILLALVIAIIDALPVFGTGTVLIPWAVIELISGEYQMAIGLALAYAAVGLVRSLLEPKLIGGQIGLHPVATLMAMYVGFCVFGVFGMILCPLLLIILKQFNEKGYVKLWK